MLSVSFVCHLSVVNVYVLNEDGVSVVTLRCILSWTVWNLQNCGFNG